MGNVKVNIRAFDMEPLRGTGPNDLLAENVIFEGLRRELYVFSLAFFLPITAAVTFSLRNGRNEVIYENADVYGFVSRIGNTGQGFTPRNGCDYWNVPVNAYVDLSKSTYTGNYVAPPARPQILVFYAYD